MRHEAHIAPLADRLSAAFEHSITWEDDVWRADPVDVELVHAAARRKFTELLGAVTADHAEQVQARILLFHGQSGAGKTHLIRALRTSAHRTGRAYFGYAQMTPDVANYADYYLRRLVASLEKPYDPDKGGQSALARLTNGLVGDAAVVDPALARQAARCQAQRRLAGQACAEHRRPDHRGAQVCRPEPRRQHRARAALPAAFAIRASTSACASISMGRS